MCVNEPCSTGGKIILQRGQCSHSSRNKNTRAIDITGDLKIELEHWRFIDNWDSFYPWRTEMHKQITVYTDSSMYKYGVSVLNKEDLSFGDFWDKSDERPIHAKEADAIVRALQSLGGNDKKPSC